MIDNINHNLRTLAKSYRYQTLYGIEKPIGIRIFENQIDFSHIQLMFLTYLNMYVVIGNDIYLDEVKDVVLKDDIYEDSYLIYKKSKKETKKTEAKIDKKNSKNNKEQITTKTSWIFRKNIKKQS